VQLDQARIAICERTWLENLDLALHVAGRHGGRLVASALAGILPFALLNHWLLGWQAGDVFLQENWGLTWYWAMLLVMIEAPLATAPLTLYLGQALFVDRPNGGRIARDLVSCLPQLFLLQVLLRTLLIVPLITWIIPYVLWPYLNEVILLERNPLVGRPGQISTLARNGLLHRGNAGEFFLRGLGTMILAPLLIVALYVTQQVLLELLLGVETGPVADAATFQAVLWIVVVYFTVARFLGYLDQRIRNEGWEVELFLRAQRERLTRQIG
jgi:hypothetical protein